MTKKEKINNRKETKYYIAAKVVRLAEKKLKGGESTSSVDETVLAIIKSYPKTEVVNQVRKLLFGK